MKHCSQNSSEKEEQNDGLPPPNFKTIVKLLPSRLLY